MITTTRFFPTELKSLPIWILWRLERDQNDRLTKVPYSSNYNGKASSTNPDTWSTFESVVSEFRSNPGDYTGIGIMISKDYRMIFIDIDHCINGSGELDDRAEDILRACDNNQFVEISQSGSGIHILALGEIPKNFKNPHNGIEMYSEKRFCALTGNALIASELHEDPEMITYVFDKYRTPERVSHVHSKPQRLVNRSEKWILDKASQHGKLFPLLYYGKWQEAGYTSQSEADLALCKILAFWTDGDESFIDRIFRSSSLYREKWERDDYRDSTIKKAVGSIKETISEFNTRRKQQEGRDFESVFLSMW